MDDVSAKISELLSDEESMKQISVVLKVEEIAPITEQ